jgi:hypothetical protein
MSDHYITLVPANPRFVPKAGNQRRARDLYAEIAPDAEAIEIQCSETIQFFDCGENFSQVHCPTCSSEIPMSWWESRMEEDFNGGFRLAKYSLPCCGTKCTLDELHYDWPQAFGLFALDAMNPNIGELPNSRKQQLEEILGTKLRVIYQNI